MKLNLSQLFRVGLLAVVCWALAGLANASEIQAVQESLESRGIFLTLLLVYAGGVAVSATPCVYPMIPITLSIIGARSAESKPMVGFARSLVFVLGIATIYTSMGITAALLGKSMAFLLQSKFFFVFMFVFLFAMGLSMIGLFSVQMPPKIAAKLQGSGSRGGYVGAFLLGITTGIVASPCGSPVLVSVMAIVAEKGRMGLGATLLFAYAMGIGLLFLVLGTFPAFLKKVPKSGTWMDDIKKLLGVVLIGTSFYYLRYVLPETLFWILVVLACLAGAALVAIGSTKRKGQPALLMGWRATGLALAVMALYFAIVKVPTAMAPSKRVATANQLLPPEKLIREGYALLVDDRAFTAALAKDTETSATTAAVEASGAPAEWLKSEAEALALAKEKSLPMLVDIGADWCPACEELEEKTFPHPSVVLATAGYVKLHIDATDASDENDALMKKYSPNPNTAASLPIVAFVKPDGTILHDVSLFTFEEPAKFIERVNKAKEQGA